MTEERRETGGLIGWWARNGVAANLLMIVTLIAGVVGYITMERMVFPSFPWNGVTVSVSWPGAAPQEIEEQIVVRLEEAVEGLEDIDTLEAFATEGYGAVNIEANRSADMNELIDEIKLRVDAINDLPDDSRRPVVRRWQSEEVYMGLAVHGDVEPRALKRLADTIRDEVARLPGASRTVVWATLPEEVAIEVSEEALRAYGLTFDEVANAIRQSSLNVSSGNVRTALGDVQLRARNLADTAAEFEDIVIRQTEDGALVRVGDVATVIDGFVDADLETRFNGEPFAIVAVFTLEENMNVVNTQRAIKDYVEAKNKALPPGVTVSMWWDDSKAYFARMKTISSSAALGLGMVFIVLILFLRPIVAFWVTIGIIVAFTGAFALLPHFDVSLNMLSLFAFLLVIGIVVDDAIIVGENIHNQVERGMSGHEAAIHGTRLVAKPVVFAVVTTMMAFAPWMLLSGPEVQFTRQISLVVIAALTFSLIESLLILPNHLAHMKPQRYDGFFGPLARFQRRFADSLVWVARRIYRPIAETAIRNRYVTFAGFLAMFVIGIAYMQMGFVKWAFMPEVEGEFLEIEIEFPEGAAFSRVTAVRDQLDGAIERVVAQIETDYAESADEQVIESVTTIASNAQVEGWVGLTPPEVRPAGISMGDVAQKIRDALGPVPDAEEVEFDFTFNQSQDGVRFALRSRDLDELREAADDLKAHLATYDAVVDVRDNIQSATDEVQFTLKPGAESLGLTLGSVTRQVRQAFFGEEVQRLPRDGEDVRVMVRYPKETRESLDSLQHLRIRTADGREVPLSAVADVEFAPGVQRIFRRERERAVFVVADLSNDTAGEIQSDLNENFFPAWERRHPDVTRGALGNQESQREFMQEFQLLFLMMVGAMYVLLAIAFRAVFQPILIILALPFAWLGALIGHAVIGLSFGLFSIFGAIAAGGVVINDNLVLLDYVNRLRARGAGALTALVEAGVARFRPILLTSVTTFIGILPMIAERSTQAQFLKPMVVSLGFAVLFALVLTLLLVPALYAIGADIRRFFAWAALGQPYRPFGAGYDPHATLEGDMGVAAVGDEESHAPASVPAGAPKPAE